MAKIYTKTGDDGTTSLVGGDRISKSDDLLNAYGTIDELNAVCGLAECFCQRPALKTALRRIQNELFTIGSHMSCANEKWREHLPQISGDFTIELEREIDQMTAELEELKEFILPGGCPGSAQLHLARTVARRAERHLFQLDEFSNPAILQNIQIYLNRISDWMFVAARAENQHEQVPDLKWEKP